MGGGRGGEARGGRVERGGASRPVPDLRRGRGGEVRVRVRVRVSNPNPNPNPNPPPHPNPNPEQRGPAGLDQPQAARRDLAEPRRAVRRGRG